MTRVFPLGQDDKRPVRNIAVVGVACRLPGGVGNAAEYWNLLTSKKTGIREIPEDRWDKAMFYDSDPNMLARSVSKWGGFIDDVSGFDPQFFGLSPREATSMDPQQRLVLQAAYEAIEDSGMPWDYFSANRTGVFVGIQSSDYREIQENRRSGGNAFGGTSLALCIVANRVSHRLNLNGPSYAVDTACSSSLTALNQAVLNLRQGQCDHAIVTGVNLNLSPKTFLMFSKAGMLSNTGTLSTFDAAANGFVRGEGVGSVVLKPLDHALADGNEIYAVIEESAANQDGFTSTITAPNQVAQIAMLEDLMERGGVTADMIGYVEAHGTGTPIGDPIEAGAIGRVIGQRKQGERLLVGSVKPNIGHLESGAGINGLIKVALTIKHGQVAPNINFKTPNPRIPFDALNIEVPTETTPMPEFEGVRRGIVNSFGFGGANASALLASAPERSVEGVYRKPVAPAVETAPMLFPISARSEKSLQEVAAALAGSMRSGGALADTELTEVAAALGSNRTHHLHRAVVVANDKDQLLSGLDHLADPEASETPEFVFKGQAASGRKVCFMFAGQGSQWWAMARDLLENNTVFQEAVDAYDVEFVKAAGWSIKEELLRDEASSRIDDTTVTQPALFAIQIGLCAVWKSWGLNPDMVVGHSIGEAAAAYLAGGLSLTGAARFLSKRGAIRDQLGAKGAMAAIGMNVEDVKAILPEHGLVGIAAVNGPGSTTISGDYDAVHAFVEEFAAENPNILARTLRVDTAWHSYQLEAGEAWFRKEVAKIDWMVPHLPFISTVTGRPETRFDIDYGWQNLRQPVMFQNGIACALDMGASVFLEMGPHTTLSGPATSTAAEHGAQVEVINSLNRKQNDFLAMAGAAARLFVGGTELDWQALNGEPSHHVTLPPYPWANERHWTDSEEWRSLVFAKPTGALLGLPLEGARPSWMTAIDLQAFAYLGDHRLQAECVFPGAGYMDLMFEAARHMFGEGVIEIEHMRIHEALFIPAEAEVRIWTQYVAERNQVQIYSQQRETNEDWVLRADGIVRLNNVKPAKLNPVKKSARGTKEFSRDLVYQATADVEVINYGPTFQTIRELWASNSRAAARVSLDPMCEHRFELYETHPSTLDACLQLSDPRLTREGLENLDEEITETFMPIGAQQIRLHRPWPKEFLVYSTQRPRLDPLTACTDFVVTDLDGEVVLEMKGLLNRSLEGGLAKEHPEGFAPHFALEEFTELRPPARSDEPPEPGRWLVLADDDPDGSAIVAAMRKRGAQVEVVSPDAVSEDETADDLADLVLDASEDGPLQGILYAWNLGTPEITLNDTAEKVAAEVTQQSKALIALGAALDEVQQDGVPLRLMLITRNARPTPDGSSIALDGLAHAPLVAAMRTIANECQDVDVSQIDADADTLANPARLVHLVLDPIEETEIILRATGDYVPRMTRYWPDELPAQDLQISQEDPARNFRVTMQTPGVIDNLELVETPLEEVGPDEVRVKVAAVGLNFRDVMAVTGLLPREAEGEPAWLNLGLEFGGTIVAVGKGVKDYKRGDRVMGLGKRCLQRFISVNQSAIAAIPDHISFEEAATIPSAFATAHYALNRIGHLSQGEKVLIHVATGGVGTAAVQMAKNVGAEIFATAGSPAKRKLLKEWGIKHVMNSRDLSFADEIMRITKGDGVDVVLNSLPGAFIDKGIEVLAPYGRFLEIGKRDVYEDSSIGMKALRRNVSLSVLDLAAMGVERPQLLGSMFRELSAAFVARNLEPLPLKAFPVSDVADAVRFMSQAKHVGKVVVTFDQDTYSVQADQKQALSFEKKASYLITGGNGGFGLSIAEWMARSGAGKLILASRSGTVSEEDMPRVRRMEKAGTKVQIVAHDVTDQGATKSFIAKLIKNKSHPLKGVLHAAAVIKDGFIAQLTPEMIEDVIWPKVAGAWSLHKAFDALGTQPDFMISFSSIASMTGAVGQANYVAANGFLDALATHRKALGDAGGAINWGAIAATGIVGRNEDLKNYLESMGLKGLEEAETPAGVETLLTTSAPNLFYANADWQQMSRTNARLHKIPRLSGMLQKRSEKSSEVRERLMTLEGEELLSEIQDFVLREIGNVLKIEPDQIDPETAMNDLGLDSLSSFELKMRIETALGLNLQVSRFLQAPTVTELVALLGDELENTKREAALASERGGDEDTEAQDSGAARNTISLSDRGLELLKDTVAGMTTDAARLALEHRMWVEVSPGLDEDATRKAIKKISNRHVLLRTHFDPKTGSVTFDAPALQLQTVDRIEPCEIPALNVTGGEIARVTLANAGSPKSDLFLQLHQGIGDAESLDLIIEELLVLLSGEKPARVLPKNKLQQELERRTYDAERPVSQNDRAYWHYALTDAAERLHFKERKRAILPIGLGRNSGPAVEWVATSASSEMTETEFVLAFADALSEATGHTEGVLLDRQSARSKAMSGTATVAPLTTDLPILVPSSSAGTHRAEVVRRVLAGAEQHDSVDLCSLQVELADQFDAMQAAPFQVAYSFGEKNEDDVRVYGGFAATRKNVPSSGIAHDLQVHVTRTSDGLRYLVRMDADAIGEAETEALIQALSEKLGWVTVTPFVSNVQSEAAE